MEKFTFFWGGPFSNWAKSPFIYKSVAFGTSEQAMMWEKAMMFGDTECADLILKTPDPREQKALGRKVRAFDKEQWDAKALEIVTEILRHKFRQHQDSYDAIIVTKGTTLVEASPLDNIWGIGLVEGDPATLQRETWQGTNWLGIALTTVRDELLLEHKGEV